MPWPKKGETKSHYISRAIPEIMSDTDKDSKQAAGQAYGMWKQKKPKGKRTKEQFYTMARAVRDDYGPGAEVLFSVYKNPDRSELKEFIPGGARGWISNEGDLYLEGAEETEEEKRAEISQIMHGALLRAISKRDPELISNFKDAWHSAKNGVTVQRYGNTPDIYIGESISGSIIRDNEEHYQELFNMAAEKNPNLHFVFRRITSADHADDYSAWEKGLGNLLSEGVDISKAYHLWPSRYDAPDFRSFEFTTDESIPYKIVLDIEDIYYREGSPKFMEILFGDADPEFEGAPNYHRREVGIKEMYRILATVFKAITEVLNENPLILALVFDADKGEDKEHKDSRQKSYRTMAKQLAKYFDWNYAVSSASTEYEKYYVVCPQMTEEAIEEMLQHHEDRPAGESYLSSKPKNVDKSIIAQLMGKMAEGEKKFMKTSDPKFMKLFYKYYLADSRYALKDLPNFPKGLDLENCDIVFIGDEYIQFRGGGDWQEPVSFSFGVANGKPEIVNLYDSISVNRSHKKEISKYLDEVKAQNGELKESISKKYYWADGGPTRYQNTPNSFNDINAGKAGMALEAGFDLNKREVKYSGPVVGDKLHTIYESSMRDPIGATLEWTSLRGEKHHGPVVELDGNVVFVDCDLCGKIVAIEDGMDLFESKMTERAIEDSETYPYEYHHRRFRAQIPGTSYAILGGFGSLEGMAEGMFDYAGLDPRKNYKTLKKLCPVSLEDTYNFFFELVGDEGSFLGGGDETRDESLVKYAGPIFATSIKVLKDHMNEFDHISLISYMSPSRTRLYRRLAKSASGWKVDADFDIEMIHYIIISKETKMEESLDEFFNSLEEDVGMSGDFQAHAPEHMIGMNGVANIAHNKGTGNTKHGKMDDRTWDSAYTRTRSEDFLRVHESSYTLKYEIWPFGEDAHVPKGERYAIGSPAWVLYAEGKPVAAIANENANKSNVVIRYIETAVKGKGYAEKLIRLLLEKGIPVATGKADHNSISPSMYKLINRINETAKDSNIQVTRLGPACNGDWYPELNEKAVDHYEWRKRL